MIRSLLWSVRSRLALQLFALIFPASAFAGMELFEASGFGLMNILALPQFEWVILHNLNHSMQGCTDA